MNKKIIFLILFMVVLTLPFISSAAGGGTSQIKDIVSNVKDSLVGLGAGLATIGFIVSGILFISSTANPSLMTHAKSALIAAAIGIVIILLADGACLFIQEFTGLWTGTC